ncbi:MAG: hypothetical protein PHH54_03555 [Candidatus Nanoarchaeia archaeon]|nr:hypothetical protein [Candidatus Nanoarchaeia archaeon]MDD5741034.1 hypothetical protein [Candidatus Nanoarchaeia archaeon]
MNYDLLREIGAGVGFLLGSSVIFGTGLYLMEVNWRNKLREDLDNSEKNEVSKSTPLLIIPSAEKKNSTCLPVVENNDWYLWLNLTKNNDRSKFVENHQALRTQFVEYGRKYEHLQIHNGDFDALPSCLIVLASRSVPSSRYCMAKTTAEYKSELDGLKSYLVSASLENRVIGPTCEQEKVTQYGDNFELQKIINRR